MSDKAGRESQYLILRPKLDSDPSIGSDRDSGCDIPTQPIDESRGYRHPVLGYRLDNLLIHVNGKRDGILICVSRHRYSKIIRIEVEHCAIGD